MKEYIRKSSCQFLWLMMLLISPVPLAWSGTVVISSAPVITTAVNLGRITSVNFVPRRMTATWSSSDPLLTTSCLDLRVHSHYTASGQEAIYGSGWTPSATLTNTSAAFANNMDWYATFTNRCGATLNGALTLNIQHTNGTGYTWSNVAVRGVTISRCSTSIETTPSVGNISTKDVVVNLTSNSSSTGTMTFTPSSHSNQKGLLSDSTGNTLNYNVEGATWNAASSSWSGAAGNYQLRVSNPDPAVTKPGLYSGTMEAKISCP